MKYFQGAEEFSFRDLGRSMDIFREHRHRPGGGCSIFGEKSVICTKMPQ